jgi:hypothetical protein
MDNMEKMLQQLLAQIGGIEEKMDSNQKKAEKDRNADKEDFLARMKEESRETNQGLLTEMKEDLLTEMKEDRKADQEKIAADREDF